MERKLSLIMDKVDIIIPLGAGSRWQNNELRYALRSVEKYLYNVRRVIIVGELPEWIRNVDQIQLLDEKRYSPARNIFIKTEAACISALTSDEFIFMSDDHFLLQQVDALSMPPFYDGELIDAMKGKPLYDPYLITLKNTIEVLKEQGVTTLNYNLHCPMKMNKKLFIAAVTYARYDWEIRQGYALKSLYGNVIKNTVVPMKDVKIRQPESYKWILKFLSDKLFFSINNRSLNDDMKRALEDLFPNKSKYEA